MAKRRPKPIMTSDDLNRIAMSQDGDEEAEAIELDAKKLDRIYRDMAEARNS